MHLALCTPPPHTHTRLALSLGRPPEIFYIGEAAILAGLLQAREEADTVRVSRGRGGVGGAVGWLALVVGGLGGPPPGNGCPPRL